MSPELAAALASLLGVLVVTGINISRGWNRVSSDYVTSLKGLVEARDRRISDLEAERTTLTGEVRRLENRVRRLEDDCVSLMEKAKSMQPKQMPADL